MTQWLLEEAAFLLLDVSEALEAQEAREQAERHARLTAMAQRAAGGR